MKRCADTVPVMTLNPVPTKPTGTASPLGAWPRCPICGSNNLVNVQEIEERREYPILPSQGATDVEYGVAHVPWTIYTLNSLQCLDCQWEADMESSEADEVLS